MTKSLTITTRNVSIYVWELFGENRRISMGKGSEEVITYARAVEGGWTPNKPITTGFQDWSEFTNCTQRNEPIIMGGVTYSDVLYIDDATQDASVYIPY